VIGTLDLEHAIREGQQRFFPGLLAAANRGILYLDEVSTSSATTSVTYCWIRQAMGV